MNYRKFGKTDLLVSEVGFGAWAIGGNPVIGSTPIGWGAADDTTSVAAIRKSLDLGINFFDTADFYGLGHSEELLGKELSGNKEVILATKVGNRVINDNIHADYSKDYILNACEQSLRRLKRDFIDFYQLHSPRMQHFEKEQCIEAMDLLQKQGKIRYWGLSLNTFSPGPEADFLMDRNSGYGFQLVFNLISQLALPVMEKAYANGFGVIVRMPLQFGLLTGKFSSDTKFAKDDHRSFRLTSEIIRKSNKILDEKIWPLCDNYGISKISLALSYILSFDSVSTVIPGIRTVQHVIDNTNIVRLKNEDVIFLKELYKTEWEEIVSLMEKLR
jgi:aryl-alcohol dehydrogenase-like predicted oxidoreductase